MKGCPSSPLSIAIATCNDWPLPGEGLLVVMEALEVEGYSVTVLPWQDGVQAFADADLILPLAIWDYAKYPQVFRDWLDEVSEAGGRFGNCPKLMAWNMEKSYLLDLQQRGVTVPKTILIDKTEQVLPVMEAQDWPRAVIKPAIGQSGHGVRMLEGPLPDVLEIDRPHILQDWVPEIKQGELSMIFLNGGFSHAVTRMPSAEDWRANSQYGVTVTPADAPVTAIGAATACLSDLATLPLYARVDGVMMSDGDFLLTELELIEPAMFFNIVPGSASGLAQAICSYMNSQDASVLLNESDSA
ncbi:ATP-grasp domain-containing protein [Cohaesibacter gelatinilyticus]|uniref:Glutathione synthetase, ATP-grasp domain n=1 Tax=Cohaesibacter gelatinilyticus TaxID=372072 RepID=A0A285PCX7_9HYPH|nr:glutathione synthetase [Cohaesibacter gelatinilyticus]SNZ19569.1 glutathione synthetase, ATP-grasp domain [Cohaesibacter gelatinilyticus]